MRICRFLWRASDCVRGRERRVVGSHGGVDPLVLICHDRRGLYSVSRDTCGWCGNNLPMTTKFAVFFLLDFSNSAAASKFLLFTFGVSSSFIVATPFVTLSSVALLGCDFFAGLAVVHGLVSTASIQISLSKLKCVPHC